MHVSERREGTAAPDRLFFQKTNIQNHYGQSQFVSTFSVFKTKTCDISQKPMILSGKRLKEKLTNALFSSSAGSDLRCSWSFWFSSC